MSETINVPMAAQRDIKTVTTEIRTLHRQAQCMVLGYAIEIGRRLKEAKAMLDHGQWGPWLREEVDFSQSSANNFMRIFEEYGAQQVSLFGDANSQVLGNLPYTHALRLLALPAEERESFVEEHHAEHWAALSGAEPGHFPGKPIIISSLWETISDQIDFLRRIVYN